MSPGAFITGCAGTALTAAERSFIRDADPWGLILFARNCREPDQVGALVAEFRAIVGRGDAPVLIDQEGGRVQRLKPPQWPAYPPAAVIAALCGEGDETAERCAWLAGRLIGEDLHALGITVDCVPVLDLKMSGAHDIIGDRSFGPASHTVVRLAAAMTDGLRAAGVAPVMKHVPGHGRARVDSHYELPVVDTARGELEATDFVPFRRLSDLPMAMTAHVVYRAIDEGAPATLSPRVVGDVIRGSIGFDGLLMTDDLSMGALSGSLADRAAAAYAAGCDMALHCNGDLAEMTAVAGVAPALAGEAAGRAARALRWARRAETDLAEARREFAGLIERAGRMEVA